jgi:hypothetical protein
MCSTALLRGLELRSGPTRVAPSEKSDAYDQAAAFVRVVGADKALQAAQRALDPSKKSAKKGRIKWL